ncbi:coiled-coil domain-containing protein 96 isoform X2 [Syngnathoides biaculeatus]|uniref:coiled-coil domain-containing protein 96 isoform X2 n=1 Tax=Syngnathoides biaculeatus TaxID=300417 RepID=UPI002ADD468F|nr:coiled-coil domain-containing protein 96 isoform X2 [Syngnathoides biaculeatus]
MDLNRGLSTYFKIRITLQEEDHRARGRNAELQAQLASYFNRKDPRDRDEDPEPDAQEYEECLKRLVHLRRQKSSRLESARRHEEKLRLREREQLKQVEDEWESVSTLKGKLAVSLLSGHFWAPEAARAKVEATLEDERLARRELRTLRLKHAETEGRVGRLEALLRAEEGEQDKARDLLLLQFEQMLTQRTRRTKVDERGQEASGLRKNMKRTLELLSNMKEKLHWIQTEVQAKRDQLAQLEATLSAGRDLLARTRRARAGLRRDNAELRRRRGLLGDALLLRDFGVTAGAARRLQEELEKLKSWREERASAPSGQF